MLNAEAPFEGLLLFGSQMQVHVCVWRNIEAFDGGEELPIVEYTMNHNDPVERKVLGMQCRAAFEAGQVVLTYPVDDDK